MSPYNKRTIIIGLISLAVGVAVGVGAAEYRAAEAGTAKTATTPATGLSSAMLPSPGLTSNGWDPFQQIRDMQLQMDRMFSQMSSQFRQEPQFSGLAENPGYSLSLNVQDDKNRYEVTAFLPDAKASDVHVNLENKQTLKVDVNNGQTLASNTKNAADKIAEWGHYEQVIQLPAPVKAGEMKIEQKNHELLITLPKE